jgi:hypothetical protein
MIKAKIFKVTQKDKENELKGLPFYIQDIYRLMCGYGLDYYPIVELDPYEFNNNPDDIKEALEELTSYPGGDCMLVIASSYTSIKEFPEDKYYLDNTDYTEGKEKLPLEEILIRQSKILKEAGFKNINKYCCLEFSEPHIWPGNEFGNNIKNYLECQKI